ncbi:transcription termination factor MTEF1, chloroplastic [Fagus crenata]
MQKHTIHFLSTTTTTNSSSSFTKPHFLSPHRHHDYYSTPQSLSPPRNLHFPPILSLKSIISLPLKPPKTPEIPSISPPPHSHFQEKMLYLDSIGLDFLPLINHHPPIISTSLSDIKSTVDYVTSTVNLTSIEFRRIVGMCPEILTSRVSDIVPIFTFLLREARVNGSDLKRVINRRPRLLACSVELRLRPTLYFLQSIGISEVHKHTALLSCSVEDKLIPRIEYFEKIGFSRRDSVSLFRRFPQLFNYSVKQNFEPKFDYFVVEMGRELKELKEFPQYFSFSLENRIKPRHQCCVEKGVCFPLPVLLKTSEEQFRDRLEVCCNSSIPLRHSPLWCTNCDIYSNIIE